MKLKSLLFALMVGLFVTGGVYGTINKNAVEAVEVFYINGDGHCVSDFIEDTLCPIGTIENCIEFIPETQDYRQIYADILDEDTCLDPYEEPYQR